MTGNTKKAAIFIMPRPSSSWEGAEALWITVGGIAAAAERKFGKAYILTTDKISTPQEVLKYPVKSKKPLKVKSPGFKYIPKFIRTIGKDFLLWRSFRKKSNYNYEIPVKPGEVAFVWEQHDLFPGPGKKLAKKYRAPLIKKMDAPAIWESKKWGVKRYVWGWYLQKYIEIPSLLNADLLACVSIEVEQQLKEMGIPEEKLHISPMAFDPALFSEKVGQKILKAKFNITDELIIGWIGSFRSFHGLDHVISAFKIVRENIPNVKLMLVGSGSQYDTIIELVNELNLSGDVIFAGKQEYVNIPKFVGLFDIALVSAANAKDFHYSPMKLREYMGAGVASIAPKAGELPIIFKDKKHLLLYRAGSAEDMADKILALASDFDFRKRVASNGKEYIHEHGTWDVQLDKMMLYLEDITSQKKII